MTLDHAPICSHQDSPEDFPGDVLGEIPGEILGDDFGEICREGIRNFGREVFHSLRICGFGCFTARTLQINDRRVFYRIVDERRSEAE